MADQEQEQEVVAVAENNQNQDQQQQQQPETEAVRPAISRVVIVTGAGCGLGYHVARLLVDGGNDVVLAGKNEEQIKASADKIKEAKPDAVITHLQLDLASMESIRRFVDEFRSSGKKLNAVVACDGVKLNSSIRTRRLTADNFEMTIGFNHLGHFLLTNLLLSDLENTARDGGDARVVVVTSSLHDVKNAKQSKNLQPFDIDNIFLFNDKTYTSLQAYKNSRTANLLFTYDLARRLQDLGIKVNAVCPGVEPVEDANGTGMHKIAQVFMHCITAPPVSMERSAADVCALVTDDKFKDLTGKYIKDGVEAESSEETRNEELQTKLWELSARYCHLDGFEPLDAVPPPVEEEPPKKASKKKSSRKADKEEVGEKEEQNGTAAEEQNGDAKDEEAGGEKAKKEEETNGVVTEAPHTNGEQAASGDGKLETNGTEEKSQPETALEDVAVTKTVKDVVGDGNEERAAEPQPAPVVQNGTGEHHE
jgi:light-dependent protochlorophyllide reductase